jgi:hypothetical protein
MTLTAAELFGLAKYAALIVPAAVGAYLGSYLKKKGENLATHEDIDKLVKQVSAVTVATKQIEARINRASHVHERQLDILQRLYRHLYDAQDLLKRMTATGRIANEITPQEYEPLVVEAMNAAREEFVNGRLFIPPALVQQCEGFFSAVLEGRRNFAWAHDPMMDPVKRVEFWSSAATVAYKHVPQILEQIDFAARTLIHGEAS